MLVTDADGLLCRQFVAVSSVLCTSRVRWVLHVVSRAPVAYLLCAVRSSCSLSHEIQRLFGAGASERVGRVACVVRVAAIVVERYGYTQKHRWHISCRISAPGARVPVVRCCDDLGFVKSWGS